MEVNKKNMNPFVFNQNSVEILQKMKFLKDNWNNDKIQDVNEVIHYSMFDLDINIDNMPDQWGISNTDLIISTNNGEDLSIQTSERVYIYTHYPIKLKKGNTYLIEIKTRENVDNLSYFISGVTPNPISLINDNNKYTAELLIEQEPNENGN